MGSWESKSEPSIVVTFWTVLIELANEAFGRCGPLTAKPQGLDKNLFRSLLLPHSRLPIPHSPFLMSRRSACIHRHVATIHRNNRAGDPG